MFGGKGFYRGTSILISGTAGTGKSSLTLTFADAACKRGEKCLYITFEESPDQVLRNMKSIGLDLQKWVDQGLLQLHAVRSTYYGLETHLVHIHKMVESFNPDIVIVDPITNLITIADPGDVKSMLTRLIDYLKGKHVTAMFTNLSHMGGVSESTESEISSLMDTWILVRELEYAGERNRGLYVLKSRGMPHSNQIREFKLSDKGIELLDVYVGPSGVLTGSARVTREAEDKANDVIRQNEIDALQRELERKQKAAESRIAEVQAGLSADEVDLKRQIAEAKLRQKVSVDERQEMGLYRREDKKSA
jgi:circadian clock protein KaiC